MATAPGLRVKFFLIPQNLNEPYCVPDQPCSGWGDNIGTVTECLCRESAGPSGAQRRPWGGKGVRAGHLEEVTLKLSAAGKAGKGIPDSGTASQQGGAPDSSLFPVWKAGWEDWSSL